MKKYILCAILFSLWIILHGFIYIDCMLDVKFQMDENPMTNATVASNYAYLILNTFEVLLIILLLTEVFLLVHIAGNKSMNKKYIIITVCIVFGVTITLHHTVFYANNIKIVSEIKDIVIKITYKLAGISMLDVALCFVGIWIFKKKLNII